MFAAHDVTRDPPFTRIDLLSCRNLLIYLLPQQQARVLNLLHFALAPKGTLFLGPSELPSPEITAEFEDVDRKWHVYRKRRDVRLQSTELISGIGSRLQTGGEAVTSVARPRLDDQVRTLEWLAEALLRRNADCAVLVTSSRAIDRIVGDASRFLRIPEGRTDTDLVRMAPPDLRTSLSIAMAHATRSGEESVLQESPGTDGPTIEVRVVPLVTAASGRRSDARAVAVLFSELPAAESAPQTAGDPTTPVRTERVRALESELARAQQNLHATVEQLETANEELQSANEELLASNEELQSTNEELHSVNEELFTVNAEHQAHCGHTRASRECRAKAAGHCGAFL